MADADDLAWDADEFDPDAGFNNASGENKWEGEDANLVIPVTDEKTAAAEDGASAKPKKSKKERIDEKKAGRRKTDDDGSAELTEEEEKLKKLMLQRQADLGHAVDLFGDAANSAVPQTTEEFAELGKTLADQISKFDSLPGYYALMENLVRCSTVSLDAEDCRRLAANLTALAQEKTKMLAKEKKPANKKKGKKLNVSKVTLRDDFDLTSGGAAEGYDDDFDFM